MVDTDKSRRPRGFLESDVKRVCDSYVTGDYQLDAGQSLTPHRIANRIKVVDVLDEAPSTGAVAAVMARWQDIGFATFAEGPFAFTDYTQDGIDNGLEALKARAKAAKQEAKREAKAAAAPVPTGAGVSPESVQHTAEAEAEYDPNNPPEGVVDAEIIGDAPEFDPFEESNTAPIGSIEGLA